MSHFTVLVIGNNPEEQLAPYQENNCGDCPKQYLKFCVRGEDGEKHWFENEEEFKKSGIKPEDEDDGGYWENPNKKRDWYQLGGRWNGFFKIKEDIFKRLENGENFDDIFMGNPSLIYRNEEKPGMADMCRKKYIDFDSMRETELTKVKNRYNKIKEYLETEDKNIKNKIAHDYWFTKSELEDFEKMSNENFIKKYIQNPIQTFAIIKDGKRYQKGDMGWRGAVADEKEPDKWREEFEKLIEGLSDDTLLSVFDCHI